jgi:hypothetical protein
MKSIFSDGYIIIFEDDCIKLISKERDRSPPAKLSGTSPQSEAEGLADPKQDNSEADITPKPSVSLGDDTQKHKLIAKPKQPGCGESASSLELK